MGSPVLSSVDARGIATVTLNRPEKHNALDATLIADLGATLGALEREHSVRVLVLTGAGATFCAGADIDSMRASARASPAANLEDALRLSELLAALNSFAKPTVARINGNVFGGGVGLVSCCDIAIASTEARFTLSEIRLGILPAMISPYVVAAIGARQARRYVLTGEPINAHDAQRIGLVHETAPPASLEAALEKILEALLKGGPAAQMEAKELIREVSVIGRTPDRDSRLVIAQRLARLRASEEGQEGLSAFLEKRAADWIRGS
ncbi:MAG TPA: enoyl-CoA hydratase-related protein [Steroidobacteraceae bacterium]|nr:enoyl-CoA hydratase-related protein [Steroidobacteraceae bacterium]